MANEANVKAVITAEDRASKVLAAFGKTGAVAVHKLKIATEIAGAAVVGFAALSVKAYSESENQIAQTNAVLKSTGQVAGVTEKAVGDLATALQKVTKYSDEDVRSVENLLLTFTSIGKDIFPQATSTVLDMATALGEDTKSASIQLGKALQDPVLGVTALRRVGVNFSEAQKEVIQKLVDTNQKAKAQKLILKELQTEFGGSAKAAGDTFAGKLVKLRNAIDDVQEVIGGVIVNRLSPFITKALEAVAAIDWQRVINNTINSLKRFYNDGLKPVFNTIKDIATQIANYLLPKLEALFNSIKDGIPTFKRLYFEVLVPLGKILGVTLVLAIGLFIDALNLTIRTLTPLINLMLNNKPVVLAFAGAFVILAAAMAFNNVFNALTLGFNTFRLITIPKAMASMTAFRLLVSAPLVMGAIGISAALIAAAAVYQAWRKAQNAIDAATASANAQKASDSAVISRLRKLEKTGNAQQRINASNTLRNIYGNQPAGGLQFASGGFTGRGGTNEVAGTVHKGEFVLPKTMVDQNTGLPKITKNASPITINLNVGALMGNDVEARKFAKMIQGHITAMQNSKGALA